jgi:hypothetical protein
MKRLGGVLIFLAVLTWAVLMGMAVRDPEREPELRVKTRTGALVVAFIAGSVLPSRRKQ